MPRPGLKIQEAIFLFFSAAVFVFFLPEAQAGNKTLYIKGTAIEVELADTPQERARGLMFRKTLAGNAGMLFLFEQEDRYSFWMKNMNFSLDIIWINKDKKIAEIMKGVPPCADTCASLTPRHEAKYVLEVNAGFADKYLIKAGDEVSF